MTLLLANYYLGQTAWGSQNYLHPHTNTWFPAESFVTCQRGNPRRGIWHRKGARDNGVLQTRFTGSRRWHWKQRKVNFYCPVRAQRWRAQEGRIFTRVADSFPLLLASWLQSDIPIELITGMHAEKWIPTLTALHLTLTTRFRSFPCSTLSRKE